MQKSCNRFAAKYRNPNCLPCSPSKMIFTAQCPNLILNATVLYLNPIYPAATRADCRCNSACRLLWKTLFFAGHLFGRSFGNQLISSAPAAPQARWRARNGGARDERGGRVRLLRANSVERKGIKQEGNSLSDRPLQILFGQW